LLTGVAIAAVIAVILVLAGFENGLYHQLRRSVLDRGADLFVTQAGVANLLAARSSLRQLTRADVEAVAGVANAHPLTAIPIIYSQNGIKRPAFVWVYDTRGGPPRIHQGGPVTRGRDIVIDQALAETYGLSPGDPFVVSDFEFTVAGITSDASALFTSFAFVNYDGLIDLFLESEIAPDISTFPLLSFLLVELEPGALPEHIAKDIDRQVADVDVFTPTELAANDVQLGRDLFGPILGLLITIAYLIGLLVVGLITYADVTARLRDFGILKALGFTQRVLTRLVLLQTSLLLLVAFPVGMLLAQGIAAFIQWSAPLYLVQALVPASVTKTLIAGFALAILGAMLPVRVIARLDPMVVFHGT
jgi:ABC-type antimicrobial peptide transport system permease subunit